VLGGRRDAVFDFGGRVVRSQATQWSNRLARHRWRWGVSLAAVALLGCVLSACGAPANPGIASVGSSSTTTTQARARSASGAADPNEEALAYSKCMRSHGVPGFPDPGPSGGFQIAVGVASSPSLRAAQAKCEKLLPAIGGGPGSGPPPTAQALAQMLKVSQCMRRHGISDFPDPRTTAPPLSPAIGEVADRDGVILVFPRGFDQQSPRFTRAAEACNFQVTNH
jgi:hypothetical protein